MGWSFSISTWIALISLGVGLLTLPKRPPFWVARLCFVAAASILIVNSVWWSMNTNLAFGWRALIVGSISALAMIALSESFRWVWRAEASTNLDAHSPINGGTPPVPPVNVSQGQSGGQSAGSITNTGPVYNAPVTINPEPLPPKADKSSEYTSPHLTEVRRQRAVLGPFITEYFRQNPKARPGTPEEVAFLNGKLREHKAGFEITPNNFGDLLGTLFVNGSISGNLIGIQIDGGGGNRFYGTSIDDTQTAIHLKDTQDNQFTDTKINGGSPEDDSR